MKKMTIATDLKIKPVINGDPNLLKILVTNLVNNAIKYGKPETEIRLTLEEKDGMIALSVFNEGVGISREDIETRLFQRFSRLKQKGTEGVKGTGLGLYICKTIAEKHNGVISVESEQGKWVRFTVTLPVQK